MMETELGILSALNKAGSVLTSEALKHLDTDGALIETGGIIWHTKGKNNMKYQCFYGEVQIKRHVYQKSCGGNTYCPLEDRAWIVSGATPLFAKQVSSKFSRCDASVIPPKKRVFKSRIFRLIIFRRLTMKKSRYSDNQIMNILKQAESGVPVPQLCREHGMSCASFYKLRSKYGGMDASMIGEMKAMAEENRRLKKMYAEMSIQNELLKEALRKKF